MQLRLGRINYKKGNHLVGLLGSRPKGWGYRELLSMSGLSDDGLQKWLKRLRSKEIVIKYPTIPIMLTDSAREKYKKNIPHFPLESKVKCETFKFKRETKQERLLRERKINLRLNIVGLAIFGSERNECGTKPKKGDVLMPDLSIYNETHQIPNSLQELLRESSVIFTPSSTLPGVGLSDFFLNQGQAPNMADKRKNLSIAELFSYIECSKLEVEKEILYLESYEPQILKQNDYRAEKRYGIADPNLEEFVRKCFLRVFVILRRMRYADQYTILSKDIKNEYIKWYQNLFGKYARSADDFLIIRKKRESLATYEKKDRLQEIKFGCGVIKDDDADIKYYRKEVKGPRYEEVRSKYSLVVKPLLNITFPAFLKDDEQC